jgi:K+ potassium transporter
MTRAHVSAPEGKAQGPARPDAGKSTAAKAGTAALTLGALGVVFGDIGTSPLYAMSSIFRVHGVRPNAAGVDGMISLVIWTIILVVMVKYVTFVIRADNRGEGGIVAWRSSCAWCRGSRRSTVTPTGGRSPWRARPASWRSPRAARTACCYAFTCPTGRA